MGINTMDRRPGIWCFFSWKIVQILNCVCAQSQIRQTTLEMEEKFSFLAAEEIMDIWTGIWVDRSQITSLP